MAAPEDKKPDYKVIPTPKRFWLWRWWLWFLVVVFVSIFSCYQWNHYQNEKFNSYLQELGWHGIKVEVNSVSEHQWVLSCEKYLPSFITELVSSQQASLTLIGDEIRADSLKCLEKLPTITSMTFKDTPNLDDASLAPLSQLESLTRLNLINTPITARGLVHLQNLRKLVIDITPKNSLTKDEIEQLLSLKPTIYIDEAKAESVKPGAMEMINSSGTSSVKLGDDLTFRGSFTSMDFVPAETQVTYYRQVGRIDALGPEAWQIIQGGYSREFTKQTDGTYQFLTRGMILNKPGRYRAEIKFAVRNQAGDQLSSSIWFTLAVQEFEVKEKSTVAPEELKFKPKLSLQWPGQPYESNVLSPHLDGDFKIYNATLTDHQPADFIIYLLDVIEYPVKDLKEMTPKGLLDASTFAFRNDETSRQEIEFGPKKYPGLDITISSGKGYTRKIVVLAGRRLYSISATSSDEQALQSDKAKAFFKSLAIGNDD